MESKDVNEIAIAVYDASVTEYLDNIRKDILDGKSVVLPGIGVIKVKYRKVKNDAGREFSLKPKLISDKKLDADILRRFTADPTVYDTSNTKRQYTKRDTNRFKNIDVEENK